MTRLTPLISSRSPVQAAIVETVDRYGLVTASQLRRLHYRGTKDGIRVRSSNHFSSLVRKGLIRRLPFRVPIGRYGAAEYAYTPPESNQEVFNPHMYFITELYVRLTERLGDSFSYDPEEWAHGTWGGVGLKPDAHVRLPTLRRQFFVEVDRSSQRPSVIAKKMNRYVRAYGGMDGGRFPYVLWTCRTPRRKQELQRVANARAESGLFVVALFDDSVRVMTGDAGT
jgi:Replication-relaxation